MAALNADVNCTVVGAAYSNVPLKSAVADTFYRGGIVYIDTAGGVQPVYAAGDKAIGICMSKKVAAIGDLIDVLVFGFVWLPVGTNIAAADENDYLINDGPVDSDNPADLVALGDITVAAGDMIIGKLLRVEGSNMLVHIGFDTGKIMVADDGTGDYIWQ